MLGFPLLYFKGMRLTMFQLSGFYCRVLKPLTLLEHSTPGNEQRPHPLDPLPGLDSHPGGSFLRRTDVASSEAEV